MAGKRAVVVGAGGIARAWFPPLLTEKVKVVGSVELDDAFDGRVAGQTRHYGIQRSSSG